MTDPGAVLALVGPTASGKTSVAMEVARSGVPQFGGGAGTVEIVAVDAFTVYRGMDVGTAKPAQRERDQVAHHMVDILDPWEEVTVQWFQVRARTAVEEVRARGNVPLLVGGSGLYFRAVVDDLRFPPTDAGVRDAIEGRYADHPEDAHARLTALDPAAAAKIEPGNLRRSVRALEVIELTGESFSSFADAWDDYRSIYPRLEVRGIDRDDLRTRVESRAGAMVAGGLLDEARMLRSLPHPLSRTASQAIGYHEAFAVLDGELAEEELADEISRRTWRYAKRQRAWFRRDPRITWSDADGVLAAWCEARGEGV